MIFEHDLRFYVILTIITSDIKGMLNAEKKNYNMTFHDLCKFLLPVPWINHVMNLIVFIT